MELAMEWPIFEWVDLGCKIWPKNVMRGEGKIELADCYVLLDGE
jgi:hypothetical protein